MIHDKTFMIKKIRTPLNFDLNVLRKDSISGCTYFVSLEIWTDHFCETTYPPKSERWSDLWIRTNYWTIPYKCPSVFPFNSIEPVSTQHFINKMSNQDECSCLEIQHYLKSPVLAEKIMHNFIFPQIGRSWTKTAQLNTWLVSLSNYFLSLKTVLKNWVQYHKI